MTPPADTMRAVAQAKVNLFLRVLAREQSGYHQIETLFCRLELGDVVTVRLGGSARTLACAGPAMPEAGLGRPEDNLAWRAADAYLRAAGIERGFHVEIEKRIPVGGGLGGGSADAAAVLRALHATLPLSGRSPSIADLAVSLGADVPFLATDAPLALAWGRGERMLAFPPLPPRHVALAVPPFRVATAEAYGWIARSRAEGASAPRPRVLTLPSLASWDEVDRLAENDFEPVVTARHPGIDDVTQALRERGARIALMSGSGSTVFGVFDEAPDAAELERATGCRVLLTRTAERVVPVEPAG